MRGRAIVATAALLLTAGCSAGCRRAADVPPLDLDAAVNAAHALQQTQGPRAAVPELDRLLAAARARHSRRHEGLILGELGTAYKNLSDYDQAMALHERALAIKRELGDEIEIAKTLSNMGLVEWARGNCTRALALYQQSLDTFTRLDQPRFAASVLNNQGLCYDMLGEFGKSVPAYERALAIHRQQGDERRESEALGNLGGVALLLGRYPEAVDRYQSALAISRRLDARQSLVLDLLNLGLAKLGTGERAEARAHLLEAQSLAHDAGLGREEADATRYLSTWLAQAGRYDEARRALSDAAATYARAGLASESVDAMLDLGNLDLETGDVVTAAASFARAAAEAKALKHFRGELDAQLAISELEVRRNNLEAALAAAEGARRMAASVNDGASLATALAWQARVRVQRNDIPAAVEAGRLAVATAETAHADVVATDARLAFGDALLAAGRAADARSMFATAAASRSGRDLPDLSWRLDFGIGRAFEAQARLDEALAAYLRAVATIEQVRSQLSSSRARAGFLDSRRDVYSALIRLLLRLGRTRDAFEMAERLRAQGYRELLQRSLVLASGRAGIPAAVIARIHQLQAKIDGELRDAVGDDRGAALATYEDELRTADAAWQTAVDDASTRMPWTRTLTRKPLPTVAQVQRQLAPRTALLEYVVDPDRTIAFVLTHSRLTVHELPVAKRDLRNRIELLRGLLARRDEDGWKPVAERLDADLLAPVRRGHALDGVTRLYVVPHAELNYLPFAVLRHIGASGPRYLIDDVAMAWLPAASALVTQTQERPRGQGLLALAPARARLPFAREEVESVAKTFPGSPEVLAGAGATETRFKHDAASFRVIHFATHGFFNRINPLFSGLELEPGGEDDGQLQVFEILGQPLTADLVALSACDTAMAGGELTDWPAGEELVGLTRAFLSAGARHVLATLWAVNDRTTAGLMAEFYERARGVPLPDALAAAQRRRAHGTGSDAHPWNWAPFVVAAGGVIAENVGVRP